MMHELSVCNQCKYNYVRPNLVHNIINDHIDKEVAMGCSNLERYLHKIGLRN